METNTIKEYFLEAVRMNVRADSELRDKLLHGGHPRVEKFLENLNWEIKKARQKLLAKGRILSEQTIKTVIYDFTDLFMRGLEDEAKQRYESDLAKSAREAKLQERADMESTLDGKSAGIFEEAGVVIDETRKDEIIPTKGQ